MLMYQESDGLRIVRVQVIKGFDVDVIESDGLRVVESGNLKDTPRSKNSLQTSKVIKGFDVDVKESDGLRVVRVR